MSNNRSIGIIHLSDIHFGKIEERKFEHAFFNESGSESGTSFHDLVEGCLKQSIQLELFDKLFLVISGDLVCDGSKDADYEKAFGEVESLCSKIGITDKEYVVIVPGNHDINRKSEENGLSKFVACYNDFFKDISNKHINITDTKEIEPFGKKEWLHCDHSNRVIFIPLFSVYTDKDKIPKFIKDFFKEEKKFTDEENWFFDRGLIDEKQLKQVEQELDKIENSEGYIKIAVLHHNPLPVTRANLYVEEHDFPSICQLANGSEVLARLQKKGVSLVLHGHTHQNSINTFSYDYTKDGLVILGASHFCKSNTSLPWTPEVNEYGFNFIDINGFSATPKIKLYRFTHGETAANQLTFKIQDNYPIELYMPRLTENEIEKSLGKYFLNFNDGIKHLSELIKNKDNKQIYLLNYSYGTKWIDHFNVIWEGVVNSSEIIYSLLDIYTGTNRNLIKSLIIESLNNETNTYKKALVDELRNCGTHIINRLSGETQAKDSFTSHIKDHLTNQDARDTNYFLEIFRCVIDKSFKLKKSVYFKYDLNNSIKFKWLCDSIKAARSLDNFDLAWLPFSIKNYSGNSLVAALNNASDVTVLIGYHEKQHENHCEDKKSVLRIPDDTYMDTTDESGLLYTSLRALLRKIIVPLSERLSADFPLYVKGKLYIDNLAFIARIYNCETVWNDYKNGFQKTFKDKINNDEEHKINKSKIEELYKWVAKVDNIKNLHELEEDDDKAIPWKKEDYVNLLKNIGN